MKKLFFILLITLTTNTILANLNGRIKNSKTPSITTKISLEDSSFLYIAPIYKYISINFGFLTNKIKYSGITFGPEFQWIDGDNIAGTVKTELFFTVNRKVNNIKLGAFSDISVISGTKKTGFKLILSPKIEIIPRTITELSIETKIGIEVSPTDSLNFFAGPGFGYIFGKYLYFNLTFEMEALLWK